MFEVTNFKDNKIWYSVRSAIIDFLNRNNVDLC
jgi:hypothetical protein